MQFNFLSDYTQKNLFNYHDNPKHLGTNIWANSVEPDQTAPLRSSLIRVYTVCYSINNLGHVAVLKPTCLLQQ